jgi:plasmid stabilization system protein ParE
MRQRFRLAPEARQDIKEIWAHIAHDSLKAAARVREEIRNSCRWLARHPHIGHRRDDLTTREDVLFWPVYSYLIIYRPNTRPLEILRVLHGKRNVISILG